MTLSNLISTGSGRLAARWEIEGLAVEFCTEPGMEQTLSDGRRRLCVTSLDECGFSIEEMTNIPEALLEARATSLTLWETLDEDLSGIFHQRPGEMFGAIGISDSDTTLTLFSTAGRSVGDVLHIGTEAVRVGAVVDGTNLTLSNRAYWGTVAQYHYADDTDGHPHMMVTDAPLRVRGRQVRLWLYGDGDDLQGNGTLTWIGIVRAEPMLVASGMKYRLSFGPITDRLKTKIGGDLDTPARPRGAYYPATAGLRVQILETTSGGANNPFDVFTGHFEDNESFCTSLSSWFLNSPANNVGGAGLDSTYTAEATDDGRWTIRVVVGSNTTSVAIQVTSEQDGVSTARAGDMRVDNPNGPVVGDGGTISSGDILYVDIIWHTRDGHLGGTVPRGFWGFSPDTRLHKGAAAAVAPHNRVYVDRDVSTTWSSVAAEWPGETGTKLHTIDSVDASTNRMDLNRAPRAREDALTAPGYLYTASQLPDLSVLRTIAVGNLADMRNALITESIQYANLGTTPFLTSRDVSTWTGQVRRSAVLPWQAERFYAFSSSVDFEEFLAHECRLLGLYPATDTTGKITLVEFDLPTASTTAVFDIDEEISYVDGQAIELSSMARGNQTVNRVHLKTGYNPRNESWTNFVEVQDRTAYALDHQDRPLMIEPRSWAVGTVDRGDGSITGEDLAAVALPVLSVFGYPHEFVNVKVTWKAFDLRIGDPVTFSASHLPSYITGARPISSVNAIVVGRKWKLGEAFGELTLLLSWQNVAGYAPTARVSSQAVVSGNQWDLTIDTSLYSPAGTDPEEWFAAGDQVRIWNIDEETATVVAGEVDSVTAGSDIIRVTFDGTWTPGSDTWELGFDTYTATGMADDQKTFAFYAGTDLLLGTSDAPRTLAA